MATGHFDYINSKRIPYPNREYTESFTGLVGGVNTYDQPFNLKSNEAAMMKNLSWRAGVLGCRRGQVLKKQIELAEGEEILGCADFLFHGWMAIQSNYKFYFYKVELTGESSAEKPLGTLAPVFYLPQPDTAGTFFRYRENVYFKTTGYYFYFTWNVTFDAISIHTIANPLMIASGTSVAFIPVIQIDTDPVTGAGNPYQKENRLSNSKTVIYIPTPAGTTVFQLPVTDVGLRSVKVDGVTQEQTTYTFNGTDGTVTFNTAPATDSTVSITYNKANPDAYGSLMDSNAVAVFGGAQDLCVVMGGPPGQPNCYYWSGHNGNVMDPTYFPINQYNLAGDIDDPITCFGKQQNMLTIFQTNATGRAVFGTETIGGLVQVTMDYTRINAEIGCDLPGSLQLVQNNLVWANRKYGVCRLKDSSAAYENNITVLSRKINGGRYEFPGLLEDIATEDDGVYSTDTGTRYILVVGTDAYEWNYELSSHENPSWFLHTGIQGVGYVPLANDALWEVTADGKIATFEDGVFTDFDEAIEKQYRFPPRNFGTYDRLKNIMSAIFTVRADTNQNTQITYICDYAQRYDPTNMVVIATDEDSGRPFAIPFRRKPGYHNIKHLQTVLYNNEVGKDLSIIDATIFYTLRGRLR